MPRDPGTNPYDPSRQASYVCYSEVDEKIIRPAYSTKMWSQINNKMRQVRNFQAKSDRDPAEQVTQAKSPTTQQHSISLFRSSSQPQQRPTTADSPPMTATTTASASTLRSSQSTRHPPNGSVQQQGRRPPTAVESNPTDAMSPPTPAHHLITRRNSASRNPNYTAYTSNRSNTTHRTASSPKYHGNGNTNTHGNNLHTTTLHDYRPQPHPVPRKETSQPPVHPNPSARPSSPEPLDSEVPFPKVYEPDFLLNPSYFSPEIPIYRKPSQKPKSKQASATAAQQDLFLALADNPTNTSTVPPDLLFTSTANTPVATTPRLDVAPAGLPDRYSLQTFVTDDSVPWSYANSPSSTAFPVVTGLAPRPPSIINSNSNNTSNNSKYKNSRSPPIPPNERFPSANMSNILQSPPPFLEEHNRLLQLQSPGDYDQENITPSAIPKPSLLPTTTPIPTTNHTSTSATATPRPNPSRPPSNTPSTHTHSTSDYAPAKSPTPAPPQFRSTAAAAHIVPSHSPLQKLDGKLFDLQKQMKRDQLAAIEKLYPKSSRTPVVDARVASLPPPEANSPRDTAQHQSQNKQPQQQQPQQHRPSPTKMNAHRNSATRRNSQEQTLSHEAGSLGTSGAPGTRESEAAIRDMREMKSYKPQQQQQQQHNQQYETASLHSTDSQRRGRDRGREVSPHRVPRRTSSKGRTSIGSHSSDSRQFSSTSVVPGASSSHTEVDRESQLKRPVSLLTSRAMPPRTRVASMNPATVEDRHRSFETMRGGEDQILDQDQEGSRESSPEPPKRRLSFRDRLRRRNSRSTKKEASETPSRPSSSSGFFSLKRRNSNKVTKDPPGDPWYRLRLEAEKQEQQEGHSARPSYEDQTPLSSPDSDRHQTKEKKSDRGSRGGMDDPSDSSVDKKAAWREIEHVRPSVEINLEDGSFRVNHVKRSATDPTMRPTSAHVRYQTATPKAKEDGDAPESRKIEKSSSDVPELDKKRIARGVATTVIAQELLRKHSTRAPDQVQNDVVSHTQESGDDSSASPGGNAFSVSDTEEDFPKSDTRYRVPQNDSKAEGRTNVSRSLGNKESSSRQRSLPVEETSARSHKHYHDVISHTEQENDLSDLSDHDRDHVDADTNTDIYGDEYDEEDGHSRYRPGAGLYLKTTFLKEWKHATTGTLSLALMDLSKKQSTSVDVLSSPSSPPKDEAWWEASHRRKSIGQEMAARPLKAEAFEGEYNEKSGAPTKFRPNLRLQCGPLLRYTGLRRERTNPRNRTSSLIEREFWRGSIMIVTEDSLSSYEIAPTLRLFVQPIELLPVPPDVIQAGSKLAPEFVDPIAGHPKLGPIGETLYVRPVEQLDEGRDLSIDASEYGLFERTRSHPAPDGSVVGTARPGHKLGHSEPLLTESVLFDDMRQGPTGQPTAETSASPTTPPTETETPGSFWDRRRRVTLDGERAGKYTEVRGFRVHTERGLTFWRFNMEVELGPTQQRIAYRINRGPAMGFWVPGRGESMNVNYYSNNSFTLGSSPDDFCGPDPMWRDVLNCHQSKPFHVMVSGGGQVMSDAILTQCEHYRRWSKLKSGQDKNSAPFTPEMQVELENAFLEAYCQSFSRGLFGLAASQIPMINMWDGCDLMEGYGSLSHETMTSPVMRGLGAIAFKYYMLFQHQSVADEGEDVEASWIVGGRTGPYVGERSRSVFVELGADMALLAVDCRTERTEVDVMSQNTWDKIMDRCFKDVRTGDIKHLLVVFAVPLAYPRLAWIDNLLGSRLLKTRSLFGGGGGGGTVGGDTGMGDASRENHSLANGSSSVAVGSSGVGGGAAGTGSTIPAMFLDEVVDHWTHKNHKEERKEVLEQLQDLAAIKSVRITLLSGHTRLASISQFLSNPKFEIPKHKDFRYMPNIVASAMANAPATEWLADVLNKRAKTHHFDKDTDENVIPMFDTGAETRTRGTNYHFLPQRHWCSITKFVPTASPSPPPSPTEVDAPPAKDVGLVEAPRRQSSLRRALSAFSRSQKKTKVAAGPREESRPPVTQQPALFRTLSRQNSSIDASTSIFSSSSRDQVDAVVGAKPKRTSSLSRVVQRVLSLNRKRSIQPSTSTTPTSPGFDMSVGSLTTNHPAPLDHDTRGHVARSNDEFYAGDEEAFSTRPFQPAQLATSPATINSLSEEADVAAKRRMFHRTPTMLTNKQKKNAPMFEVNLEGGLEICINAEVYPRDPSGITVPYRLLVPQLFYDDTDDAAADRAATRSQVDGSDGEDEEEEQPVSKAGQRETLSPGEQMKMSQVRGGDEEDYDSDSESYDSEYEEKKGFLPSAFQKLKRSLSGRNAY